MARRGARGRGAAAYALVRLIEAYGLWRRRPWAEWLAALSASVYVPFELYEIARRAGGLAIAALLLNPCVVAVMVRALLQRRY